MRSGPERTASFHFVAGIADASGERIIADQIPERAWTPRL